MGKKPVNKLNNELSVLDPIVHRFLLDRGVKDVALQFKKATKTKSAPKDATPLLEIFKFHQSKGKTVPAVNAAGDAPAKLTNGNSKRKPDSSSSEESSEDEDQMPVKKIKLAKKGRIIQQ